MLNIGRMEPEAWWMIIFPGLAIFVTITVYNLIGEGLRDALDPKNKR
jgi:peptide/nickel transport system permease protein